VRRAVSAAAALVLLSCASSDDASGAFPDDDGEVVLPAVDADRSVRFAMGDELDEDVHTYLAGGAPIVVYGNGDDLVFVQRSPADSVADVEPDGWQPFNGWPSLAEGERYLLRRTDGDVVFGWRRGATDAAVEAAVAGSTPAGFELVGELPEGWRQALDGPQYVLSEDDGDWHVALRRSPPSEQAALRALLKDAAVAAEFVTRASVDAPIATTPTRRVEVDGRAAMVGPLDEDVRVLVVEGDPGLTVLTTGARASTALTDDELVAIAEDVRTATRAELAEWVSDRFDDELRAQRDALEEIGDIVLEVTEHGRAHTIVAFEDGSRCLQVRMPHSREVISNHCAGDGGEQPVWLLPSFSGPGVPHFEEVVGIVDAGADVRIETPGGGTISPTLHDLTTGGAAFFADVTGEAGPVVVTVDGDRHQLERPA
jgi:hypothetical protein